MSNRAPSSFDKAFALVFAVVASTALVELGLRWFGPEYSRFSNVHAEYFSNPRGYFDTLWTGPEGTVYGIMMQTATGIGGRSSGRSSKVPTRILGLGDSQAQGQGVRYQDTFYVQLSEQLGEQGIRTGVRNVAVSGYDLEHVVARYAYETSGGHRFPLVIYSLVLDDFGLDRSSISGLDFIQHQGGYSFDPLRQRSAIYNLIAHTKEQAVLSSQTSRAYLESFSGDNLAHHLDMLSALDAAVRADGGVLVIAVLPLLYDFDHYPFEPIHQTLAEAGAARNLRILDLKPALSAQPAADLWVHPTDHHPNEVAHRIVGKTLAEYLQREDLQEGLK